VRDDGKMSGEMW